jgi:hypothetical protein
MNQDMADHPDPHSPDPAPIAPKKSLPGKDANFSGNPPIVDIDEGSRDPKRPARPGENEGKENPDDGSGDRGEGDHIESAEHVERELPSGNAGRDR